MERQIFLVRVNPINWTWDDKDHNWDDLEVGGNVSFDGDCENYKDIRDIKLHDVFVGYNMNHPNKLQERNLSIVCIGRIISDGCFKSVGSNDENSKRFLVQKVLTLKNPLPLTWMKENIKSLGVYQHTVIKLSKDDWTNIKNKVVNDESKHEKLIKQLESGWTDISLPD